MKIRFLLGTGLVVLVCGLLALDAWLQIRFAVSLFIVLLGLAGWCEMAVMGGVGSRERGGGPEFFVVGALATAYFLGLSWFSHTPAAASPSAGEGALVAAGIAALHGAAFTCVICRAEPQKAIHPLLLTLAGPLLVGLLFSYALKLYQLPRGTLIGVVFFFGIKGNDIAAYLVGKAIGRIRFLKVSPRKTLEGCLAAVVFSIVWFTAVGALWPAVFFPWPWAVPAGILLSISSQIGDLSESVLKRAYGVKDSGILLPEFGGVLDLIDSTLLSGFLFWSFLQG